MSDAIFGNFLGDFLGLGSFDEPPDSLPLKILGLDAMPADKAALRLAFVRKVQQLHPDLNPLEEGSWREVAGDEWEEVQWARSVLLRKLPRPAAVTGNGASAAGTLNTRNAEPPPEPKPRPVTDRTNDSWSTLNPRNAAILTDVEREVEYRARVLARDNPPTWGEWRTFAGLSDERRFTEVAIDARLVCRNCAELLGDLIYVDRRRRRNFHFGDSLAGLCAHCWEKRKRETWNRDVEGPRHRCRCGVEVVCVGDTWYSIGWWYSQRARSCSPRCFREQEKADLRERRREARAGATCAVCGDQFEPGRRGACYCSNACRQDAYRKRKLGATAA